MIVKAKEFLTDVVIEVKKVTWPSKKEAIGGTMVVLVLVFIMAIYLGLVDTILSKIVESLIRAK
ncbi:MAG: preprotein translocase subunit SecE [Nitrospinales bacterium]